MEKFIPDLYQKSIYDINYKKLKKRNIKCLIFDLDNTLVPYSESVPSKDVQELFHLLKKDFKVIIMSNSGKNRLKPFKEMLNVDVAYSSKKPFKKKYLKIFRLNNLKPEDCACIGDQLMTDVYGANRVGCVSIFINSMSLKEPPWTKFNRIWEGMILKKFRKKGILEKGVYYE